MRIPVSALADPANRLIVCTDFGWRGPAFLIAGAVVWGYTGETLAAVLRLGGWERPWTTHHAGRPQPGMAARELNHRSPAQSIWRTDRAFHVLG
jgi:hypothetical protein